MHPARARLAALALLAALAASMSAAGLLQADHAGVLHPGPTRPTGRAELPCERLGAGRCPPTAARSPATTLAEPGYVPEPAGPPPTATTRR